MAGEVADSIVSGLSLAHGVSALLGAAMTGLFQFLVARRNAMSGDAKVVYDAVAAQTKQLTDSLFEQIKLVRAELTVAHQQLLDSLKRHEECERRFNALRDEVDELKRRNTLSGD
jgi:chromosome segregation ATPase